MATFTEKQDKKLEEENRIADQMVQQRFDNYKAEYDQELDTLSEESD